MHWLVTVKADLKRDRLIAVLQALGVESLDDLDPIPIDGDAVVEVEGPKDLSRRAIGIAEIVAVHPSSDFSLY